MSLAICCPRLSKGRRGLPEVANPTTLFLDRWPTDYGCQQSGRPNILRQEQRRS